MELSQKVTAAIEKFFPEPERAPIAELLAGYGDAAHEREAERLHLIILKMSRRDVERVRSLVKAAKRDYRDVIAWASQPTRKYIVGILRRGPNPKPDRWETLKLVSLQQWKKAGQIVIGGRFLKESKDEDGALGLYIFTVDSIEAAERLVSGDPGIESGALQFEFHSWMTADGLQVGVPKDYLDIDVH